MVEVTGSSPVRPTHSLRSFVGLGRCVFPPGAASRMVLARFAPCGVPAPRVRVGSSHRFAHSWALGAVSSLRGPLHGASSLRCGVPAPRVLSGGSRRFAHSWALGRCVFSGGRFADGPRSLRSLRRSSSAGAFGWLSPKFARLMANSAVERANLVGSVVPGVVGPIGVALF